MVKNPPADAGDASDIGSIPGSGRSPGGGNANPLQCPFLKNSKDRGKPGDTVHGDIGARLNTYTVALRRLRDGDLCDRLCFGHSFTM